VEELYNEVFAKISDDMASDANVDVLRLFTGGTYIIILKHKLK